MHRLVHVVAVILLRICSHTNRTSSTVPGRGIRASRHQTFSESDTALRSGPVSLCPTLHPPASVPSRAHRVGMGTPFHGAGGHVECIYTGNAGHIPTPEKRMTRRCHRSGRSLPPKDPEEASFQAELEVRLASLGRQSGCLGTVSSNIEMMSSTQSLGLLIASKDLLFTASNHLAHVILHSRFLAMSFAIAFSFSTYPPSCFSRCRLSSPMCWYAAPQPQCGRTRLGLLSAQGEAHPTPSTHAPMVYYWAHRWQERWLHQVRNWHYLSGGGGWGLPMQVHLDQMGLGRELELLLRLPRREGAPFPEHERRLLVRAGPAAPQHSGPQARHGSSHISLLMSVT